MQSKPRVTAFEKQLTSNITIIYSDKNNKYPTILPTTVRFSLMFRVGEFL